MLRRLFSLALVALFAFKLVLAQDNDPTRVNLRIEGPTTTIFEGHVFTYGHDVTTDSGGSHHCDGTNGGANSFPGPTCTSALDDASMIHDFFYDATFQTQFDDFFITSIGGVNQTDTHFWGILLNFEWIPGFVVGCQQEVKHNDDILFAFDVFNAEHLLRLTGPEIVQVGITVVFTVTGGNTGIPVAGADVDGYTSDDNGNVIVTFTKSQAGVVVLKADKSGSIRSNKLVVLVVAPSIIEKTQFTTQLEDGVARFP